ncbi:protoporphyrinogen oxidase [Marinilactibacillus piezotolerans]|uniref:protoporphyrinogen oxidase n=1 Tax=Marinilactibacillus piezotolerans TaxID=258723 RepID=UPI0009B01768|nr:protoporphyrinogen oxidase [Marinilactibacillus piezotolerans]
MRRSKKRIAIIGSGITGLVTAYRLKKAIKKYHLPFELIVLEGTIRPGGKIHTMKIGEEYVDLGAESIDIRSGSAMELIKELNLDNEVTYSQSGKQDIYAFNKLYHFDNPSYNGIPARRSDIWKYDILSFQGKLSYLRDTYFSSSEVQKNTSVMDYLKTRIGSELTEYVAEPYFSEIYVNDMETTSIEVLNKQIVQLEKEYGNLTNAIEANPELLDGNGNQISFKSGLETLITALLDEVKEHVLFSKKVTEIQKSIEGTYILDINKKEQVRVGAIVVATDPGSYRELFNDPELMDQFKGIKSSSVGFAMFSFPKGSIENKPEGNGIFCSRRNDSHISSIVWLNKKWESLKNKEEEMIGVYFGRGNEEIMLSLSNKQIEELLLKDLEKILGIKEAPIYHILKRWTNSYLNSAFKTEEETVELTNVLNQQYPGVFLAGNGIAGFGINSCIEQGNEVSKLVIQHLKKQNSIN